MSKEDYERVCSLLEDTNLPDKPNEYDELPREVKEALQYWIEHAILPANKVERRRTSYNFKHDFEAQTGIYTSNGQFKGAMLMAGYLPENIQEQNWFYKTKKTYDNRRFPHDRETQERLSRLRPYRTTPYGTLEPELQVLVQKARGTQA